MSALNAAIGNVQLTRFSQIAATRKALWRAYAVALAEVEGAALVDVDIDRSVPHLCVVRVPGRDRVFSALRERGVGVGVHYPPNHRQPAFAEWARPLPVTDRIGAEILTLPFHPAMSERDVRGVATALKEALESTASEGGPVPAVSLRPPRV